MTISLDRELNREIAETLFGCTTCSNGMEYACLCEHKFHTDDMDGYFLRAYSTTMDGAEYVMQWILGNQFEIDIHREPLTDHRSTPNRVTIRNPRHGNAAVIIQYDEESLPRAIGRAGLDLKKFIDREALFDKMFPKDY